MRDHLAAPGRFTFRLAAELLCLLLLACAGSARAAVTLNPSPASVNNSFTGSITVTVGGLDAGETVILEKFLDANANGQIDSGEPLIQSFTLADGAVSSIGGVRNQNVPGDDDAVSGQITTSLGLAHASELNRSVGSYRFRISSPTSRFAPVESAFAITATAYPQSISGRATVASADLPYAMVVFLQPSPGDGGAFIAGVIADAGGNYSLPLPVGTYQVMALKAGSSSVARTSLLPVVSLAASQQANANPDGVIPTRTISGKIKDSVSNLGLPGVQIFLQSTDGDTTIGSTDAAGNFSAAVTPGAEWNIEVSDLSVAPLGYLNFKSDFQVNTASGNASQDIALPKATRLIYGALKDQNGTAIANAEISAEDNDTFFYRSMDYTRADGSYFLGAIGNNWTVAPEQSAMLLRGFLTQSSLFFFDTEDALLANLAARTIVAHLRGRVVRSNGQAVDGIAVYGYGPDNFSNGANTDGNGSFDIGVSAGNWSLNLDSFSLQSLQLIAPTLPAFHITAGNDIDDVLFVLQPATGSFTGTIKDKNNVAVETTVFADITLNGTNYNVSAMATPSGDYELPVFNGLWRVSLADLGGLGYQNPPAQMGTVANNSVIINFAVDLAGPLAIASVSPLPGDTIGVPYSFQLTASGGTTPYTWSIIGGTLGEYTLSPGGVISGTATATATLNFTASVSDNAPGSPATQTKAFQLTVYARPTLQLLSRPTLTSAQLRLVAQPNRDYILEVNTNVTKSGEWTKILTNSSANGTVDFTDNNAAHPFRFYRALER